MYSFGKNLRAAFTTASILAIALSSTVAAQTGPGAPKPFVPSAPLAPKGAPNVPHALTANL